MTDFCRELPHFHSNGHWIHFTSPPPPPPPPPPPSSSSSSHSLPILHHLDPFHPHLTCSYHPKTPPRSRAQPHSGYPGHLLAAPYQSTLLPLSSPSLPPPTSHQRPSPWSLPTPLPPSGKHLPSRSSRRPLQTSSPRHNPSDRSSKVHRVLQQYIPHLGLSSIFRLFADSANATTIAPRHLLPSLDLL